MINFNKIQRYILIAASILCFSAIYSGCASTKKDSMYDTLPTELLAQAQEKLDDYEFKAAEKILQAIKDRYPYSKESIIAELKLADSLFKREEYDSALDNYDEFERLHPKDKDIAYVIYQKGLCHFQQIKTIDRDQAQIIKARDEFEKLIKRYPDNAYSDKSREHVRQCLSYQCEYELYVGRYYYKMEKYQPAMERFTYLIENYPDVGQYHEALAYIAKCKVKLADAGK
jgi:outer membrane protein assembly factor BamD